MRASTAARAALAALAAAEGAAAMARYESRREQFALASAAARASGSRLVVVGDPNGGAHTRIVAAYGCGDVCVDLSACPACPTGVGVDLTRDRVPGVGDGEAVVFVSCTLEYVSDYGAAWREVLRMAGDPSRVYMATVQPLTATAALYPGARRTLSRSADGASWVPTDVPAAAKLALVAAVAGLGYLALGGADRRLSGG